MYTTQFNELLNFVCMHPDALSEVPASEEAFGGSENTFDNKARMMEIFKEFDPRVLALLELAEPSSVRLWQLFDMDPPPMRHAGSLCLLGDAALPFLPHIGQGAACALEDAASIAAVFPPGTNQKEIPERLKLYEECRKGRAEEIHSFSRLLGHDLELGDEDARVNRDLTAVKYFPYIFGYDEHDHTTQKFREYIYKKTLPHWSMPTSFGPMPGPRQTFYGKPPDTSTFVRSSVKFKTSRTLLQNLLPSHLMTLAGPGSTAFASFSHTIWSNVSWLGGRGYNELVFYIHGVQGVKADGSSLPGSFLGVTFVDSADVIVGDREDLGMPKVFCDLHTQRTGSTYVLKASWHGTEFAEMRLYDVVETTAEAMGKGVDSDRVFTHRYIPAMGNKAEPIADSIVCLPSVRTLRSDEKRKRAARGVVNLTKHDAKALPTLHHILARLAELPIFEVIEGTVVEGAGMLNHDDAYTI